MKQQVLFEGGRASVVLIDDSKGQRHFINLRNVSAITTREHDREKCLKEVAVVTDGGVAAFILNCDLYTDLVDAWLFVNAENWPKLKVAEGLKS